MEYSAQSIVVNVKLNRDDVGEMNSVYLKSKQKNKIHRFFMPFMIVLLMIVFAVILTTYLFSDNASSAAATTDFHGTNISPITVLAAIYIILYVVYSFGLPVIAKSLGKRQFDSNHLAQKETQYVISPEEIQIQAESSLLNWRYNEIFKVMETKEYIFIYESTSSARIIPKRFFSKEEDLLAVIKLLKERLPAKKYEYYKL